MDAKGLARGDTSGEDKALAMLLEMRKKAPQYQESADGDALGREMNFQAVCNASVVRGADGYYRNVFFRFASLLLISAHGMQVMNVCAYVPGHKWHSTA